MALGTISLVAEVHQEVTLAVSVVAASVEAVPADHGNRIFHIQSYITNPSLTDEGFVVECQSIAEVAMRMLTRFKGA